MKNIIIITILIFTFNQLAYSQVVAPATQEDLQQFDSALSNMREKQPSESEDTDKENDSFGDWVATEAKTLKENNQSGRELGENVSSKVRKDLENRPGRSFIREETRQHIREKLPQKVRDQVGDDIGSDPSQRDRRGQ